MKIIINSNILISVLIRDATTRRLIFNPKFKFYLPEFSINELKEHLSEIAQKAEISQQDVKQLINKFLEHISLVPQTDYQQYLQRAMEIIGSIDEDDIPFIALALAMKNDGIWSNDLHLRNRI